MSLFLFSIFYKYDNSLSLSAAISLSLVLSHIYFISVLCIHTILSSPFRHELYWGKELSRSFFGSGPGLFHYKTSYNNNNCLSLSVPFILWKRKSRSQFNQYKTLIVINHFSFLETVLLAETTSNQKKKISKFNMGSSTKKDQVVAAPLPKSKRDMFSLVVFTIINPK